MRETIRTAIKSISNVSDGEIEKLIGVGRRKSVRRKSFFIEGGETPEKFAIVLKGLFRYFYLDEDGKEFTKGFMPELSFISSYSAMISRQPSFFYIEALQNSEIFEIRYADWLNLTKDNTEWQKFLIKILERGFSTKEKRERELLVLDAESLYKNFLLEFPALEKTVKQHQIASYLGITPVALSRIKKRLNR